MVVAFQHSAKVFQFCGHNHIGGCGWLLLRLCLLRCTERTAGHCRGLAKLMRKGFLDNTFEGLRIPNWESCQPNKASHSHWLRTAVAVVRIGPGSWMLGRRHSIEAVFARARRAIADCLIRIDRNGLKFTRMPQIAVPVVECQLRVDCLWAAESRWKRNRLPREANSLLLYWCFLLEL